MNRHQASPVDFRSVLRWWPLIVLPAVIAVAAAFWSMSLQSPTYTAITRLTVVPLAQWDETFLGTSLVRDGGDANNTAATTAELLDSRQSAIVAAEFMRDKWTPDTIDRAVSVSAVPDTNIIAVSARSPNRSESEQVAEAFVKAVLADRWRTISSELDARIAAVAATTPSDPNSGEASARLQTLTLIRQAGVDPTLRVVATGSASEDPRLPIAVVLALAALGGAAAGALCAIAAVRLRRRRPTQSAVRPEARDEPVFMSDGVG